MTTSPPSPVRPVSVLVVEDEPDIRALLVMNLRREGYQVAEAADATTALNLARAERPSVVLLDLMLPDMPGTEVCNRLRADRRTEDAYVIMVTARDEDADRVAGFEVGADDYVTKPFNLRELLLRVRAGARRVTPPVVDESPPLEIGLVRIEQGSHRAFVSGEELQLTATEYRLLVFLAQQAGKLCSRGDLLEKVWDMPPSLNTRTVDTHIKRLRQKLAAAADYVETVRGAGYRFRTADSVTTELRMQQVGPTGFSLPAGVSSVEQTLDQEYPVDVTLHGVIPHMHTLGQSYRSEIRDGATTTCLTGADHWDFGHQALYLYEEPVVWPQVSQMYNTCSYDNDTEDDVVFGEGTNQEMCFFLYYYSY